MSDIYHFTVHIILDYASYQIGSPLHHCIAIMSYLFIVIYYFDRRICTAADYCYSSHMVYLIQGRLVLCFPLSIEIKNYLYLYIYVYRQLHPL